jgi:UDP-GlcNAc:undecaprenyl-phosphate GlcNAc-1-phosphate transferase
VWIVAVCNSINFFDNLDGGAAGTVAISTLGISLIAANQGQELITALAVVTCGATTGFLLWNKSPAKIYMGDAGALFLGVLVGILTIRLNPGISPQINSMAILPMLLAVPILDTCVAVLSRLRRGISPFTGGKDHLSHRLMRKGWSKRNTSYCLWAMQASFVAIALVVYSYSTTLGTPGVVLAGLYWLGAFVWFWRIPSSD